MRIIIIAGLCVSWIQFDHTDARFIYKEHLASQTPNTMKFLLLSIVIVSMFLFPPDGRGTMIVRDYTPSEHYRFYTGSDKNFIGTPYDFSGVGSSNGGHWATLVTDNCFFSATHFHPGPGEKVTFWDSNQSAGSSYTYTVTGGTSVGSSDLWLGWFDTAVTVNSSIARYPVLMLPLVDDYFALELYNYGANHLVGRNVIDEVGLYTYGVSSLAVAWYDYDNNDSPSVGGDETYLQGGDSGAPSFTVFVDRLALTGVHWGISIDTPGSFDTFIPAYYVATNVLLVTRGQILSSVPEPGSFFYMLVILCLLWFRQRRCTLR